MKFRSRPFEIEAERFDEPNSHHAVVSDDSGDGWVVEGHQGLSKVNLGDWIIAEPDGDGFYPCDPATFEAKYERAE